MKFLGSIAALILAACLLCASGQLPMGGVTYQPSSGGGVGPVVASVSCSGHNDANQTTGTCVFASLPASSCVVVAVLADDNGTLTFNTPTGGGLTFAAISTAYNFAGNFYYHRWRAFNTSSQGSTTITATWNTTSTDWNMMGVALTGTLGTAGNNCSGGIGTEAHSTGAGSGTQTVTVTSSSHNNSKYLGFSGCSAASPGCALVKGANYTNVVASTHNGPSGFMTMLEEISTSPVSPAANTTVNSTSSVAGSFIDGIEILAGP